MPLYTVSTTHHLPSDSLQDIAREIVATHCEYTGAPATFVNVIFWQTFPLKKGLQYHLSYAVRKGRDNALNDALADALTQRLCRQIGITPRELAVQMIEVPASWVMEGGHVLPEPGEESNCEWLT